MSRLPTARLKQLAAPFASKISLIAISAASTSSKATSLSLMGVQWACSAQYTPKQLKFSSGGTINKRALMAQVGWKCVVHPGSRHLTFAPHEGFPEQSEQEIASLNALAICDGGHRTVSVTTPPSLMAKGIPFPVGLTSLRPKPSASVLFSSSLNPVYG
eukprot:5141646-Prymnesium_polylepis.1